MKVKIRKGFLILMFVLVCLNVIGQITFQETIGGIGFESGSCVQQTSDGGYIIVGSTNSYGAGDYDVYLIKTKSNGDTIWTKTFGGVATDFGTFVQQTTDGGYIITGGTSSFGIGWTSVYLIKTDSKGDTLWTKTYGQARQNAGSSVHQTTDGGYFIVGYTDNPITANTNAYCIKTNSIGDTLWTRIFAGPSESWGSSGHQTTDGGYIITGYMWNINGAISDVYLLKLNSFGDTLWTKAFGGFGESDGTSVQQTFDGGYIVAGYTDCYGAGFFDFYLIKTNSNGDTLWTRTYGVLDDDETGNVQQTTDGGFVIIGRTRQQATGYYATGYYDFYLIKTDSLGAILWSKTYGDFDQEWGSYVQQTSDGGYIITGEVASFGSGKYDVYLIKTDANGNSGCYQGDPATIANFTFTEFTRTPTVVSSNGEVGSTNTIVNSGGNIITICYTDLTEIKTTPGIISPNPFIQETRLTIPGNYTNVSLFIYNLLGQEVRNISVGTNIQVTIDRGNLRSGMYFYKLIEDNKEVLGVGKMVVE